MRLTKGFNPLSYALLFIQTAISTFRRVWFYLIDRKMWTENRYFWIQNLLLMESSRVYLIVFRSIDNRRSYSRMTTLIVMGNEWR